VLAPRHERVDRSRRALEDRFDPAVGQVAHHPAQTGSLGPPGAGHAVAHALHRPSTTTRLRTAPSKIRGAMSSARGRWIVRRMRTHGPSPAHVVDRVDVDQARRRPILHLLSFTASGRRTAALSGGAITKPARPSG
jgi:hypothetical protein